MRTNNIPVFSAFEAIVEYLRLIGYNTKEDQINFKDTPKRSEKALKEMILPKAQIERLIKNYLSKSFPTVNPEQGMVVETGIKTISMCPHHLLPITMQVSAGYIPEKKVLGLSKIVRIAQTLAKQPILQEDYTFKMAMYLYENLKSNGSAVHVKAIHGCMYCRGVYSDAKTVTTTVLGWFKSEQKVKEEFLSYVHNTR